MTPRDTLLSWLNDAHSMEKALLPVLENHANDAEFLPEVQTRLRQHIEETGRHADVVQQCIESLGDDSSAVKDAIGNVTGFMKSYSTAPITTHPTRCASSTSRAKIANVAVMFTTTSAPGNK